MGLKTLTGDHFDGGVFKGRGATLNPEGRFESRSREVFDDGWEGEVEPPATPRTFVTEETARSILSENDSPDVPFEVSLNPYRGCEHGCVYCYARPSHAYLDLSPGLDFETRLFAKTNAAVLLREALQRRGYRCRPIAIGANTDPYQPIERRLRITRQVIEVLAACDHPFTIVTKNAMVERDMDLLAPLAARNLVQVFISCATLDAEVARHLEPRASPSSGNGAAAGGGRGALRCVGGAGRAVPDGRRNRRRHSASRRRRRVYGGFRPAAPALRDQGFVQGLAGTTLSAEGGPRDEPPSSDA